MVMEREKNMQVTENVDKQMRSLRDRFLARAARQPVVPCNNPSAEIVFDLETTGLDPLEDEILQISIIDGAGNVLLNDYVKPYVLTEWPGAERVHGITPERVKDCPYLHDLAVKVRGIFANAKTWIGYNGGFDLGFLAKIGIVPTDEVRIVDVMRDFATIYGEWIEQCGDYRWQKLTTCAAYYGYEFRAHDSLEDVRATLFCYRQMQEAQAIEAECVPEVVPELSM